MEDSPAYNAIISFIYLLGFAAVVGSTIWATARMKKAATAAIPDDECVACGSKAIEVIAVAAYRCTQCGYEGGSGLAKRAAKAHIQAVEAMSSDDKRRSGIGDLVEARTLLLAAQNTLESALTASRIDMMGVGGYERGRAKQNDLTSAAIDMARAQQHIRDASLKLGVLGDTGELDIDFNSQAFGLDIVADNLLVDFMVHGKIAETLARAKEMYAAVDSAIKALPVSG